MTKKEIVEKLETLGVEIPEGAKGKDLLALLKKTEDEQGNNEDDNEEVDESEDEDITDEDEDSEESTEKPTAPIKSGSSSDPKNSVTFKIRDSGYIFPGEKVSRGYRERVFSKKVHGDGFVQLADEFQAANTHQRPSDMTDKQEVDRIAQFNANIKHPVLARKQD